MKKNKRILIGLLAMLVFLGGCISISSPRIVKVKDIPHSWFEEYRKEGERLVYVSVERAERDLPSGSYTNLYIVTDNAAIQNLTNPYTDVGPLHRINPSVQNSIHINENGLAVFSLPMTQEKIGFSYYCSSPVSSAPVGSVPGVSVATQTIVSTNSGTFTVPAEAEGLDIFIRVILQATTNRSESIRVLHTTNSNEISKVFLACDQYGTPSGTGTPGFIAAP